MIIRTTTQFAALLEGFQDTKRRTIRARRPARPYVFDANDWEKQRLRRVVEAERERIKSAKQLVARAKRIEREAEELERAGSPLHAAFAMEAVRLRDEAALIMGGPDAS